MSRLIVLLALGFSAYWLYRQVLGKLENKQDSSPAVEQRKMVKCCQCGVHFPEDQTFIHHNQLFCSEEHRQLFAKEHDVDRDSDHDKPHE